MIIFPLLVVALCSLTLHFVFLLPSSVTAQVDVIAGLLQLEVVEQKLGEAKCRDLLP